MVALKRAVCLYENYTELSSNVSCLIQDTSSGRLKTRLFTNILTAQSIIRTLSFGTKTKNTCVLNCLLSYHLQICRGVKGAIMSEREHPSLIKRGGLRHSLAGTYTGYILPKMSKRFGNNATSPIIMRRPTSHRSLSMP